MNALVEDQLMRLRAEGSYGCPAGVWAFAALRRIAVSAGPPSGTSLSGLRPGPCAAFRDEPAKHWKEECFGFSRPCAACDNDMVAADALQQCLFLMAIQARHLLHQPGPE